MAFTLSGPARVRLRTPAAAQFLGIKPSSLSSPTFRRRNKIPAYRVGRVWIYDPDELQAYLDARRESHEGPEAA